MKKKKELATLTRSLSPALKMPTEQSSQSSRIYLENFHSDKERRNLKGDEVQVKKPDDDMVGQLIADRYELIEKIALGGFFSIYLGRDKSNMKYSIKVCNKNGLCMNHIDTARNAILDELHLMMKFNHPAIPKVFDIIEDEQHLFLVRECIEGETLSYLITKDGSLTAEKTIALGIEVASALHYLHTFKPEYIYQDMKPANVVVTSSGGVKLIDMGSVIPYNPNATDVVGYWRTTGYAAPEQFVGKGRIDPRADIYGLGVTLHECVTGIQPGVFLTPPICEVNPELPKGLEYIICKCTELIPDNRYQSCVELISDLRNYQNLPPKKRLFAFLFGKK